MTDMSLCLGNMCGRARTYRLSHSQQTWVRDSFVYRDRTPKELKLAPVIVSGSAFLLRSPYNYKGSCFHVRETLQGIQSRLDPYDFPLSDSTDLQTPTSHSASLRRQLGFTSFHIPEAPISIFLLMFLDGDGKITCRMLDARVAEVSAATTLDAKHDMRGRSQGSVRFNPGELLSRGINLDTAFRVELTRDGDAPDDMDVDDGKNDIAEGAQEEGDNEDVSVYQCIRTRDVWRSEQSLPCVHRNGLDAYLCAGLLRPRERVPYR